MSSIASAPSVLPEGVIVTPKPRRIASAHSTVKAVSRVFTYATTLAGIYLSIGFLFYYAAHEKLVTDSGTMPAGLAKTFHGSLFASIPGDNAAWLLLGIIETSVVVLLAVSLLRGEFLPNRTKPILLAGLSVSLFAYGVMILANSMIGNNATVIELFTYFGLTVVVMFLIRQLSPYRPLSWLSGMHEDTPTITE